MRNEELRIENSCDKREQKEFAHYAEQSKNHDIEIIENEKNYNNIVHCELYIMH